ncbi:MAG: sigma-54 dependent transcriptional regulator [candidate division WOR-3 bacterium]
MKVWVLDDNKSFCNLISQFIREKGYQVLSFYDPFVLLEELKKDSPDFVLLDLKLPKINGIEVLKKIKEKDENIKVIVITAFGSIENAIEAIKNGAYYFLTKPFESEEIIILMQKAIEEEKLKIENIELKKKLKEKEEIEIIGESKAIKEALVLAEKVAPMDTTVLLIGESGTGKELFARKIHKESKRKGPFVPINCAAIPKELLENELFGSEKGAFTGAFARKIGKFEVANGGTLFLDEISELDFDLQAKLLRAIEFKEIERLGGIRPIKVDVRIIVATNKDLKKLVNEGKFREDLYYRISTFPIYLPPLRERKEDILLLANYFLEKFKRAFNKKDLYFSEEVKKFFLEYSWPGNVRELENAIERASILADKEITLDSFQFPFREAKLKEVLSLPKGVSLKEAVESITKKVERYLIEDTLKETKGDKKKAAKILKISRKTLYKKLKELKIE